MTRFEYREYAVSWTDAASDYYDDHKKRHQAALAKLGDQGWELVNTLTDTQRGKILYTFKRPILRPKVQVPTA